MKSTLFILSALVLSITAQGQDLKVLDYAPQFSKKQIAERHCHVISYRGNEPVDTMLLTVEKFDASGRVIDCVEYMRGDRQKAHYTYSYDKTGKMTESSVEFYTMPGERVPLIHALDSKGRIVSRKPEQTIRGFWTEENYVINQAGVITETRQTYDSGGTPVQLPLASYPGTLKVLDNSLTYIFDQHQMLILHRLFNEQGEMHQVRSYAYISR